MTLPRSCCLCSLDPFSPSGFMSSVPCVLPPNPFCAKDSQRWFGTCNEMVGNRQLSFLLPSMLSLVSWLHEDNSLCLTPPSSPTLTSSSLPAGQIRPLTHLDCSSGFHLMKTKCQASTSATSIGHQSALQPATLLLSCFPVLLLLIIARSKNLFCYLGYPMPCCLSALQIQLSVLCFVS